MTTRPENPTFVVPFSHLDLFWAGTREECLSRGNEIIRRVLDIMDVYEDFCFLLETMNFVDHFLDCFPRDRARFEARVAEGRLELGPLWSAIYQNLPGGETLARNSLIAKRYARETLSNDPAISHFGDLPGYTPQYPQLAELAEIKGVLMSRGGPRSTPLFKWEGLDGTTIATYFSARGYSGYTCGNAWANDYETMLACPLEEHLEADTAGKSYPLMIHWGCDLYAPTKQMVDNVKRWNNEKPHYLQFSTLTRYFEAVKDVEQPTLPGELPSAWPNIESAWPDIWPEDMACEAALHMAEFLSVFAGLNGRRAYPALALEQAWKDLLDAMDHNQNSQGGDIADKDKLQVKHRSRFAAEAIIDKMAWRLSAQVRAPHPQAYPVVVFNSMSWKRSGIVTARAAVYGHVKPADFPGHADTYKLVDEHGNTVPFIMLKLLRMVSAGLEIAFPATDIPATGYKTWYIVPGENPCYESQTCDIYLDSEEDKKELWRNQGSNRYVNRFFALGIDVVTGDVSITDKQTGKSICERAAILGVEERRGNYIYNMTPSGREFPAVIDRIETIDNNAVWCRIRVSGTVYDTPFTQTWTLFHDIAEIQLENKLDWKGPGRWVRLQQLFTSAVDEPTIRYGVPYGQVTFPEALGELSQTGVDELDVELRGRLRLCRHWIDIGTETSGVTVAADHRMWEFEGSTLRSYMLRGIGFCGVRAREGEGDFGNVGRPPAATYTFHYTLRPRQGSLAGTASYRCGWELNHPVKTVAVSYGDPAGIQPPQQGLVDFSDSTAILTALKQAEADDGIVLRAFEATGVATTAELGDAFAGPPTEVNILERPLGEIQGKCLSFRPFEIKSIHLAN